MKRHLQGREPAFETLLIQSGNGYRLLERALRGFLTDEILAPDFRGRTSFRTSSSDTCSVCWTCALAFRAASTCRIVRPKRPRPADPRIVCVLPAMQPVDRSIALTAPTVALHGGAT